MEFLIQSTTNALRPAYICRSCRQQIHRKRALSTFRTSYTTDRQATSTTVRSPARQQSHIQTPRSFSTTSPYYQTPQPTPPSSQVHPLGAFYSDLLTTPIPLPSSSSSNLPTFVPTDGDLTKEERAAKLFGNIRGSGYERRTSTTPDSTWQTVNGVPIPPRPLEPENCCMSGCVHCVWDDYRDDVEEWAGRLREAQARTVAATGGGKSAGNGKAETRAEGGKERTPQTSMQRQEVAEASGSMDDDGGGSESLWDTPSIPSPSEKTNATAQSDVDAEDLFKGIPVGIREFMNVEKKIRQRKKARMKDEEGKS